MQHMLIFMRDTLSFRFGISHGTSGKCVSDGCKLSCERKLKLWELLVMRAIIK